MSTRPQGGRPGPRSGHHSADLERLFADCFRADWHTRLVGGADEPLYLPGRDGALHQLRYRADYFASALHEIAHWCIAGPVRRRQLDFGYWYEPDGRAPDRQSAFEAVEARPQALEWMFSVAAGYRFRPSADNLQGGCGQSDFGARIRAELERCLAGDLPPRARRFADALGDFYGTGDWRDPGGYRMESA